MFQLMGLANLGQGSCLKMSEIDVDRRFERQSQFSWNVIFSTSTKVTLQKLRYNISRNFGLLHLLQKISKKIDQQKIGMKRTRSFYLQSHDVIT